MPLPQVVLQHSNSSNDYEKLLRGNAMSHFLMDQASRDIKDLSCSLARIKEIAQVAADVFDGLASLTKEFSIRIEYLTERSTKLLRRMSYIPMDHVPR